MSKAVFGGMLTVVVFASVFAVGMTSGAGYAEANNATGYANATAELDGLGEGIEANATDTGVRGAYYGTLVMPAVETAEATAITGLKFGYQNPRVGKIGGHSLIIGVWGYLLYYTYSLIQTARRAAQ